MKSPYSFIVKPYNNRRYDNVKSYGDIEFITSTSEEDHKSSNRFAIVISTPINYTGPIKEGDILFVHHNVFKIYNDMYGCRKSGKSFFKDNLFFIDYDQFFMYHNGIKWVCHSKYCMIKPIIKKEKYSKKHQDEEHMDGVEKYSNKEQTKKRIFKGTNAFFNLTHKSDFNVVDEKL